MTSRRSRLFGSLAVVGSIALAVFTRPVIQRMGTNRLRFVYQCTPLEPAAYDALAAHPGWAKSALEVAPGVALNGLVRRPASPESAQWVLFYAGNDASQLTEGQKFLERVSVGHDWGLVVYAYRGFDSSGGESTTETLAGDGYTILADLLGRVPPKHVHVVAFSLGGFVASAAVGRAAREGKAVGSFSTLAAVETMEMIRSNWEARLHVGDVTDTLPLLDDVPGPVLVLHGTADETLPVAQGHAIAAKLGEKARFEELPGVHHLEIRENPDAINAVRKMIEEHSSP